MMESVSERTDAKSDSRKQKEKVERMGHRTVDKVTGEVSYKNVKSNELMQAIQMGIRQAVGNASEVHRNVVLPTDFEAVESWYYPREGSAYTPAHNYQNFTFYSYAPRAYKHLRDMFGVDTVSYIMSICEQPLKQLSNPGASGSLFWLSMDDKYIIKTVQKNESKFLRNMLDAYMRQLHVHQDTLLPKFYGQYCYKSPNGKHIRFIVMNNLLPSDVVLHEKYDLKGSTFNRNASAKELAKKSPTYKDLDFMRLHTAGIRLHPETYEKLVETIKQDCLVLEFFEIMDYSLLLAINYIQEHEVKRHLSTKQDQDEEEQVSPEPDEEVKQEMIASKVELIGSFNHSLAIQGIYVIDDATISTDTLMYHRQQKKISGVDEMKLSQTLRKLSQQHEEDSGYTLKHTKDSGKWEILDADGAVIAVCEVDSISAVNATEWKILDRKTGQYQPDNSLRITEFAEMDDSSQLKLDSRMSIGLEKKKKRSKGAYWRKITQPSKQLRQLSSDNYELKEREIAFLQDTSMGLIGFTQRGERVRIFIGIIDILQSYGTRKRLEHTYKAVFQDKDKVSVHRPEFYSKRFQEFMSNVVFHPIAILMPSLQPMRVGPKGYKKNRKKPKEEETSPESQEDNKNWAVKPESNFRVPLRDEKQGSPKLNRRSISLRRSMTESPILKTSSSVHSTKSVSGPDTTNSEPEDVNANQGSSNDDFDSFDAPPLESKGSTYGQELESTSILHVISADTDSSET